MRTLRKAVCLVLVAVMVMGFGAFSVSAVDNLASFSDGSSVSDTYKQAIDLLVGIQVVEGMDDGTLNLTGQYTREQAATIVARIKLGVTNANNLRCVSAPFTDVAADRWSAGAIAYCAQANILDGMGDGTFHPTEPLTGYAFGKMLLCAVGYGQRDEYVGPGWEINVAKDGVKRYIYSTSDLGAATNEAITRQQAMLMAYNTLVKAEVVKYSTLINDYVGVNNSNGLYSVGSVTSGSVDEAYLMSDNFRNISLARGPVCYSNRVRAYSINETAEYVADYLSRANLSSEDRWIVEFLNPGDEIKVPAEYSDVGRVAQVWYNRNGKNNQPEAITGIHMVDTKLGESNDGTALTDLTNSSNKNKFIAERDKNSDGKATVKYYLNGADSDFGTIDQASIKRGVTVALYDSNRNGKADVVVATEKKVFKLNANPSISGDGKTINLSGTLLGSRELEKVRGYEGLAKGDYVLYVEDAENIIHLEKAKSFTGTLTRYKDGDQTGATMYFGNDSYKFTGLTLETGTSVNTLFENIKRENGTECVIYLDNCNNIVGYAKASDAPLNYVVLLDVYFTDAGNTETRLTNKIKNDVHAKLLKTDGTVINVVLDGVTIDLSEYYDFVRDNTYLIDYLYGESGLTAAYVDAMDATVRKVSLTDMYANENNLISAMTRFDNKQDARYEAPVKYLFDGLMNKFFSYKVANNKYTLDLVLNQDAVKQLTSTSVVANGNSQIRLGSKSFFGNSNTTYIYWNDSTNNYRVVKGVTNAPESQTDAEITVMSTNRLNDTQSSMASVVFITKGAAKNSASAYFFPSSTPLARIADDASTPNVDEEGAVYRVLNTKTDKIEEMVLTNKAAEKLYASGWYDIVKGGSNAPNDYVSDVDRLQEKTDGTRRAPGVGIYGNDSGIITLGRTDIDLSTVKFKDVVMRNLSYTYAYEDDVKVYVVDPGKDYQLTVGGKELLSTDINDIVYTTSVSSGKKASAENFIVIKVAEPYLDNMTANNGSNITFDVKFDDNDWLANYYVTWALYESGKLVTGGEGVDTLFNLNTSLKGWNETSTTWTIDTGVKAVLDTSYSVTLRLEDAATQVNQIITLRGVGAAAID